MRKMGIHSGGVKRRMGLAAALAVSLAACAIAAPAMALKPTGDFVNFGDCPQGVSGVNFCIFAQSTSGEFKIGSTAVPLTKTITLQGGIIDNEETGSETFVNAADGKTVSKTPQTVPGGLLKVIAPKSWPEILQVIFNEVINKGLTGVTATTEQAGAIGLSRLNLVQAEGTALKLPSRVHLENSFLGPNCYIGSTAHPVTVEFTTGTTAPPPPNSPITGSIGEVELKDEFQLVIIKKNSLVNNSFSAPEAEGCGSQILFGLFTGLIDSAVDSQLGLPSASGHNTAILNGTLENASVTAIKASEK